MRFEVKPDFIAEGRKKVKQFAIVDSLTARVVVRYGNEARAKEVAAKMNAPKE